MNAIIRLKSVSDRFFLSSSMKVSRPIFTPHPARAAARAFRKIGSEASEGMEDRSPISPPIPEAPLRSGQQTGALPGRLLRGWLGCKDASEHQSDVYGRRNMLGSSGSNSSTISKKWRRTISSQREEAHHG